MTQREAMQLATDNLNLVRHICSKIMIPKKMEYDDAVQVGWFAAVRAYKTFDPSRGFRFSTYLTRAIKCGIRDCIDNRGLIKKPIRFQHRIAAYQGDAIRECDTPLGSLTKINEGEPADYSHLERQEKVELTREMLAFLDRHDKRMGEVMRLRYGIDGPELLLREVGDRYGLCRERIRQIERDALALLRDKYATRTDAV